MMFSRWQSMVREFHAKFGIPIQPRPEWPPFARIKLRLNLIKEEAQKELRQAVDELSMTKTADAIGDSIYVLVGMALELGIDLDPVMEEIHAANMRKEGGAMRSDGKLLKPPGWVGPDIAGVLKRQMDPGPSGSVDDGDGWK